jgi:hypothetical protein
MNAKLQAVQTMQTNGTIRDAAGALVGYYDAVNGLLHVSGQVATWSVLGPDHAMYLIGELLAK